MISDGLENENIRGLAVPYPTPFPNYALNKPNLTWIKALISLFSIHNPYKQATFYQEVHLDPNNLPIHSESPKNRAK